MVLLILGLVLFAGVHLVPSLAPGLKASWHSKFGEGGYKGSFSLLLLLSFGLIIAGWRSAQPELVYLPVPEIKHLALLLIVVGFFLFVISNRPSRVCQWIRHPQLTGLLLWALAHLLLNGDNRSVTLFGALGIWAIVEMVAINRREGAWVKAESPPLTTEVISAAITIVVVALVVSVHPYLSGMPVF
ncbi:MAG: NnrU family protein [Halioglobus sp.]